MRYFTKLTVAAALAITAMSAATSASALTFASFNTGADQKLVWNRIDNGTQRNGVLFTSNNSFNQNTATPSSVVSTFNFINYAPLAGMTNLAAAFTLNAVETGTAVTIVGTQVDQTQISGTFKFTYTGPQFMTVNNILVQTGANLLSGSFSNATISGKKLATVGTFGAAMPVNPVSFQSDFLNFTNAAYGQTIAVNLWDIQKPLCAQGCQPTRALRDMRASMVGTFSAGAIPEPATWGLMILGFAGAGGMLRSNRRRLATTAA